MMEPVVYRDCPYLGLETYRQRDRLYFFGRENEIGTISSNIRANRLTILYGQSGVGKSSLINAGVIPELENRERNRSGKMRFLVVSIDRWFEDPIQIIIAAVQKKLPEGVDKTPAEGSEGKKLLTETLERWTQAIPADIYLVLDQFEEFLVRIWNDGENNDFIAELAHIVNTLSLRVNCLISIRDDALWRLDILKGRMPNLFRNYLRLGHIDPKYAEDTIREPLERYNQGRPEKEGMGIEQKLIDTVLDQVSLKSLARRGREPDQDGETARVGDNFVSAPYLQVVMKEIWETERKKNSQILRLSTLDELGGREGIVRSYLDKSLYNLSRRQKKSLAEICPHLVSADDKRIAVTARKLSEFVKASEKETGALLEALAAPRIRLLSPISLEFESETSEARYMFTHDLLIPAMFKWRREFRKRATIKKAIMMASLSTLGAMAVIAVILTIGQAKEDAQTNARKLVRTYLKTIEKEMSDEESQPPSRRKVIEAAVNGLKEIDTPEVKRENFITEYESMRDSMLKAIYKVPSIFCWFATKQNLTDASIKTALCFDPDSRFIAIGIQDKGPLPFEIKESEKSVWKYEAVSPAVGKADDEPEPKEKGSPTVQELQYMKKGTTASEQNKEDKMIALQKTDAIAIAFPAGGVYITARRMGDAIKVEKYPTSFDHEPLLPRTLARLSPLALSGDGRYLAAGLKETSDDKDAVAVWSIAANGAANKLKTIPGRPMKIALSAKGTYLALMYPFPRSRVEVMKWQKGDLGTAKLELDIRPEFIAISEDRGLLAVARDWTVKIYEVNFSEARTNEPADGHVTQEAPSPPAARWTIPFDKKIRAVALGETTKAGYVAVMVEDGNIFVSDLAEPEEEGSDYAGDRLSMYDKNIRSTKKLTMADLKGQALRRFTRKLSAEEWKWLNSPE